jgi:hypothetical protein
MRLCPVRLSECCSICNERRHNAASPLFRLLVNRYIELRSTSRTFNRLEFASRRQCCKRLFFSSQEADRTWKRFVRSQAVPPVDEPLNVHWRCAGRLIFAAFSPACRSRSVLHHSVPLPLESHCVRLRFAGIARADRQKRSDMPPPSILPAPSGPAPGTAAAEDTWYRSSLGLCCDPPSCGWASPVQPCAARAWPADAWSAPRARWQVPAVRARVAR